MLQTVQLPVVYISAYGTGHLKAFKKSTGRSTVDVVIMLYKKKNIDNSVHMFNCEVLCEDGNRKKYFYSHFIKCRGCFFMENSDSPQCCAVDLDT